MKVIKIGIISIIVIVVLAGLVVPVPTEIGEGFETLKATQDAHRELMRNVALATTIGGLLILTSIAFTANDKFAKYTYAVTITILLFSVFSGVNEIVYVAILIAVVFMAYDVIVNSSFEREEENYEARIKNVDAHRLDLNKRRGKIFKQSVSEMRSSKKSKHKERL